MSPYPRTPPEVKRERKRLWQRAWALANPERYAEINRRSRERHKVRRAAERYGIETQDLERMFIEQDGKCAICGQPETKVGRGGVTQVLSVDHDHETGRVRGLLCDRCNTAIGAFGDDPDLMARAMEYLR